MKKREQIFAQKSTTIKWITTVVILIALLFIPAAQEIKLFLVITVWAILMWMLELISETIVGLLLPVLYIVFHVSSAKVVFSSWLSDSPWIVVGGLIIAYVFTKSGLAKRLVYKLLLTTGTSFKGIAIALTLICVVITPLIPSTMVKVAIITPIAIGLCEILQLEKKERTSSAIMMVVFLALWSAKIAFLTASTDSVLTASILKGLDQSITWVGWAKDMFVPAILWTAVSVALVAFLKPKKIQLEKSYLQEQYAALGKLTASEKKEIVLSIILIILLMTESLHGISYAYIMIIVAGLCFLPGIDLLKSDNLNKVNFKLVFYLGGVLSISSVAANLGLPAMVVHFIYPIFAQLSSLELVLSIYVFSILANFFLNPLVLIGTMMRPIAELATALGYSATLGSYAMIMGLDQVIFPYEIAPLMLLYGFGWLNLKHLVKIMAIRVGVGLIFMMLISYPYWQLVGLL